MCFEIANLTKSSPPISGLFFSKIKDCVLGKKYNLSLTLIGDKRSLKLNQTYRNKNYIPNTLSFPIEKNVGEIFLNLKQIQKETSKFQKNYAQITILMFIHSCLHLKGFQHGPQMEKAEEKYFRKFSKNL